MLPARAGMIPPSSAWSSPAPSAPRASGDDPTPSPSSRAQNVCSPRERG